MLQKDAIGFEEFVELADQSYNEIFIRNKDGKIVYANTACYWHYGIRPEWFIRKTLQKYTVNERLWSPTCVCR